MMDNADFAIKTLVTVPVDDNKIIDMIDCIIPDWLFQVWEIIDIDVVISWLVNKNIIVCNEVI